MYNKLPVYTIQMHGAINSCYDKLFSALGKRYMDVT